MKRSPSTSPRCPWVPPRTSWATTPHAATPPRSSGSTSQVRTPTSSPVTATRPRTAPPASPAAAARANPGIQNDDYSFDGYFFALKVQNKVAGQPLNVQVYDPGMVYVGDRCTNVDVPGRRTTRHVADLVPGRSAAVRGRAGTVVHRRPGHRRAQHPDHLHRPGTGPDTLVLHRQPGRRRVHHDHAGLQPRQQRQSDHLPVPEPDRRRAGRPGGPRRPGPVDLRRGVPPERDHLLDPGQRGGDRRLHPAGAVQRHGDRSAQLLGVGQPGRPQPHVAADRVRHRRRGEPRRGERLDQRAGTAPHLCQRQFRIDQLLPGQGAAVRRRAHAAHQPVRHLRRRRLGNDEDPSAGGDRWHLLGLLVQQRHRQVDVVQRRTPAR